MIDKRLYCETFSRLCASEEAKKEVFLKMEYQKKRTRLPGMLRGAAIAAAMTMALAVTAGAVNLATDGALLQSLREVWSDGYETRYEGLDLDGNPVQVSVSQGSTIHMTEDGRMLLQAAGEEVDITGEMAENGAYHFEKVMETRSVTVDVTGTQEDWELVETVTEENGDVRRSAFTSDSMPGAISVSGVTTVTGDQEDGVVNSTTVTITDNGDDGMTLVDGEGRAFQYDRPSGVSIPAAETAEP